MALDKKQQLNIAVAGTAVIASLTTGGLTLGALGAGVATNWLANLGWQGWEAARDRTLTTDDNLSRALGRAFSNAANAFITTDDYRLLTPDEQTLCREGLDHLQREVASLFADQGAVRLMTQNATTGDPDQTADTMRRTLDNYFYGYPAPFIRYVQEQFHPQRLAEQFGRELLRDEPARTAFQLLLLQTVEQQTAVLRSGQQALSADVQEVRGWLARWQATPPEQQHAQFEAALTAALDKIADEIKAHTTAEHEKTRAFIAEQVQPTVTFPIIHLPPPNPHFVGRTEHLDTLTAGRGQTAITQTISGLGGVGKSQLMLHFAHRQRDDYDIIWWLRVDEALAEDFLALGRQLRLPVDGLDAGPGRAARPQLAQRQRQTLAAPVRQRRQNGTARPAGQPAHQPPGAHFDHLAQPKLAQAGRRFAAGRVYPG
jgi:hypothetical protein